MIALTAKSAKKFKVNHKKLQPAINGCWVLDCLKLYRGSTLLLCVHQDSLYTIIRESSQIKTIEQVVDELSKECLWEKFEQPVQIYKVAVERIN